MDKIQLFEPGTYVTNGDVRGIVRGYSDNRCGVEFYIAHIDIMKTAHLIKIQVI